MRDKLTVTNNGGAPAEVNVVGFSRQDASLKFGKKIANFILKNKCWKFCLSITVPDRFSVPAGGQVEVHVTLIFHTTCSLRELVHVSFGPVCLKKKTNRFQLFSKVLFFSLDRDVASVLYSSLLILRRRWWKRSTLKNSISVLVSALARLVK